MNHEAKLYKPLSLACEALLYRRAHMRSALSQNRICSLEHGLLQLLNYSVLFETPFHGAFNKWQISPDLQSQKPLIATKFPLCWWSLSPFEFPLG